MSLFFLLNCSFSFQISGTKALDKVPLIIYGNINVNLCNRVLCTSVKVFLDISSLSGTTETPQKYEGGLAPGAAVTSHPTLIDSVWLQLLKVRQTLVKFLSAFFSSFFAPESVSVIMILLEIFTTTAAQEAVCGLLCCFWIRGRR